MQKTEFPVNQNPNSKRNLTVLLTKGILEGNKQAC